MSTALLESTCTPPTDDLEIIDDATRREFVAGLAATGLLAACGGVDGEGAPEQSASTRSIIHLGGTTEITGIPTRVIALDGGEDLEAMLLLGVTPLAAGDANVTNDGDGYFDYIENAYDLDAVEVVPGRDAANLEQVAALRPDLIVASADFYTEIYDDLSRIAPTVIADRNGGTAAMLATIAEALGVPDRVDTILDRYEQRRAEAAATLPAGLQVSLASSDGSTFFYFYWPSTGERQFAADVLAELGVLRPLHQRDAAGADEVSDGAVDVSNERLDLLDGEYLLLYPGGVTADELSATVARDPLWQSLGAVRNGRVRFVERNWHIAGPLAQLAVLDDLESFFDGS